MTTIRLASINDGLAIMKIYEPYITATSFTFEIDVPSIDEFKKRIDAYLYYWPWLVCEVDGQLAGYAYGAKYRERLGYQWCTESSVYIDDKFQRAGVAGALYSALFNILKNQGYVNVYAVINLPNDKSVAFHEKCGFTWFATFDRVGYKSGRWKDVGWWKLQINDYVNEPRPPIKFSELNQDFLVGVFESAEKLLRIK